MELIIREWAGVRFGLPEAWRVFLLENGATAAGPNGETFVLTSRSESLDALADQWAECLDSVGSQVISETRAAGITPGLLRVTAAGGRETRILTQLFVGGELTVTASYSAPAEPSYDRAQADDVIRSILVKRPIPA